MALPELPEFSRAAAEAARARQDRLTKPQGSLGRLEELAVQLAGIQDRERPTLERAEVVVAAASHGVADAGVSAFPSSVTAQMVLNFCAGGAAINALSANAGAELWVVDAGVDADLPAHPRLISAAVRRGSNNLAEGPALTRAEVGALLDAGANFAVQRAAAGADLIALGEMGIGNTTPSAALVACALGVPAADAVGRGTGVDDAGLERKRQVVERALQRFDPSSADGIEWLSQVGGGEIAFLAGLALGAASRRVPVLLDGFITTAAALAAARIDPRLKPFLLASHCSAEAAHRAALEHLELTPLLDLGLRLGEGSGAATALPLLRAAVATHNGMATFDEAGVDDRE